MKRIAQFYKVSYEEFSQGISGEKMELKDQEIKEIYENIKNKYGVDNPSKLENVKEKKKNTFIKHYGVDNYFKTKESVKKSHTRECINKQYLTKIKSK